MFKFASLIVAIVTATNVAYNSLPPTPENTLPPSYCD